MHPEELRMYEAALAGNGGVDLINNSTPPETEATNNTLIPHQDIVSNISSFCKTSFFSILQLF